MNRDPRLMALTGHFQEWYTCGLRDSKMSVAEEAFQAAFKRFAEDTKQDERILSILRNATSLEDVREVVSESMDRYSARGKGSKTTKWLQRTAERVMHYSNVFDVFAQHHPEYVSLAWGTMKFLLKVVSEHEKTVKLLAKSIAQIAENLPRVHLSSNLYPTDRMRRAVEELYASILKFLMKAYDWYNEGKLSHILHSITQLSGPHYADTVNEIADTSRNIDQLAVAASQAELRDVHELLVLIQSRLNINDAKVDDLLSKITSYHAIQSTTMLDTNQRVSDIQLSQILSHLSNVPLDDPLICFQYHLFFRNRRALGTSPRTTTNPFWLSPQFRSLFSSEKPALAVMKGGFTCRQVLQDFCVDVIQHLRGSDIPTLWALKRASGSKDEHSVFSIIDLLKYLIFQALRLNESSKTERTIAWRSAQFHRATTAMELFQLLLAVVNSLGRQVYLVIDLEIVHESLRGPDGFDIVSEFLQSFQATPTHSPATRMKVIIVRYSAISREMQQMSDAALVVVPVRAVRRGRQQERESRRRVKTAVAYAVGK
ncbi:hypothetical protein V8C37DRAFT_382944 [Trichoderma ceciliae]